MVCEEIMQFLEEQSPAALACAWDNVGLLIGNPEKEVKKIYIAVDATDEVVDEAVKLGADLLLTHHPMIFKGIKHITPGDFLGKRIIKLVQNDMAYYAMHTNFDVRGMAELAAAIMGLKNESILSVTGENNGNPVGMGRVGDLMIPMDLEHCATFVREAFSLNNVKVFGDHKRMIMRAAICPGSGKSFIKNAVEAGAGVYITGDIDHHDGLDAVEQGLCIIDAGHYGLEHIFVSYMKNYLTKRCVGVEIITQDLAFPFWVL